MSGSRSTTAVLSVVLILSIGTISSVQAQEPTHFLSIEYTVKPGKMQEFRKFVIEEWNPIAKQGGLEERHFWIQRLGQGGVVHMGNPTKLESLDGPTYVERALGSDPAKLAAFRQNYGELLDAGEISVLEVQDELTFIPADADLNVGELFFYEVERGKEAVAVQSWKRTVEASKKMGLGQWMALRSYGGPVREVVSLTIYPSYADMAKGRPIDRAFGAEAGDADRERILGVVQNLRRYIVEYDTEMSFTPESSSSQE